MSKPKVGSYWTHKKLEEITKSSVSGCGKKR
jgi:hypothetical protein